MYSCVSGASAHTPTACLAACQVLNEYGVCGGDKAYIAHFVGVARQLLGKQIILYTADPIWLMSKGSVAGANIIT
jgi:hypothetical protein